MTQVALFRGSLHHYPKPPFHPPSGFPELARAGTRELDAGNGVYSAVRDLFGTAAGSWRNHLMCGIAGWMTQKAPRTGVSWRLLPRRWPARCCTAVPMTRAYGLFLKLVLP